MADNMIDTLDHLCIVPGSAIINEHPKPDFWYCKDCGTGNATEHKLQLTAKTAQILGAIQNDGSVLCPNCSEQMEHSGPQHFAELHVDVCLDESIHTGEKFRNGEITAEEYAQWFNSLTDREKLGQYERVPRHHLTVRLSADELSLEQGDPDAFAEMVHSKLVSRLKVDAHYVLQHRYQVKQRKACHLVKHFKKSGGGSLPNPPKKTIANG
jgi:hypothetical protein